MFGVIFLLVRGLTAFSFSKSFFLVIVDVSPWHGTGSCRLRLQRRICLGYCRIRWCRPLPVSNSVDPGGRLSFAL